MAKPAATPPDTEEPVICDEQLEIVRRRYKEARAAGLSIAEATLFADSRSDIGHLRTMVDANAPPDLIARVVL